MTVVPKISVIIPAYNCEDYITKTLLSVENQTYQNIEIIIVNDGSTDNTLSILNNYTFKNEYQIITQANQGLSEARNTGLTKAKGEFVFFLDADDFFENNLFAELMTAYNENTDWIIARNIYDYYADGITNHWIINDVQPLIDKRIFIYVWGKLYRRTIVHNNHLLFDSNSEPSEDFYFNIRYYYLLKDNAIGIIANKSKFFYRILPSSLSNELTSKSVFKRSKSAKYIFEYLSGKNKILANQVYMNNYLKLISLKCLKTKKIKLFYEMLKLEKQCKIGFKDIWNSQLPLLHKSYLYIILSLIKIVKVF